MVIAVRAHCNPLDIYIYIYMCVLHIVWIALYNTIHMYSGITSGRVLNGELLYTKILEVNLFAFAYRLFRRDFSPLDGTCVPSSGEKSLRNSLYANANKLTSRIFVYIFMYKYKYKKSSFITCTILSSKTSWTQAKIIIVSIHACASIETGIGITVI